jgi:hypothetical protein
MARAAKVETKRTFTTTIFKDDSMCYVEVPFDPKAVFGKVRAPVKVTLNGYTFRSTIASMGCICVPLRKSNREAAGLSGTETLSVTLELDTEPRVVEPPADLVKALKTGGAWTGWQALSYSHQREWAEAVTGAKKPDTRTRRIESAVTALAAKPVRAKAR